MHISQSIWQSVWLIEQNVQLNWTILDNIGQNCWLIELIGQNGQLIEQSVKLIRQYDQLIR